MKAAYKRAPANASGGLRVLGVSFCRVFGRGLSGFAKRIGVDFRRVERGEVAIMRTQFSMVVRLFGVMVTATSALAQPASLLDSEAITSPTSEERTGADVAVLDVTGIPSMDRLRSPNNVVLFLWVGPFNVVNGFGFDVLLQTLVPDSRLSDIGVAFTNTAGLPGPSFGITPAFGDNAPGGPTQYSVPIHDLSPVFSPVPALADGFIRVEFFDAPDEAAGQADALWISGSISLQTLNPIPDIVSPGTVGLFGASWLGIFRRARPVLP